MPLLPSSDFADLSPRGVSDGHPLHHRSWGVRSHAAISESGHLRYGHDCCDLHGLERAHHSSLSHPSRSHTGDHPEPLHPGHDSPFELIFRHFDLALAGRLSSFIGSVTGEIFGAGLLYAVAWLFRRFGNPDKQYLGFGDVMLMLLVGVFLGIPLTYVTILLGSLAGTLFAVALTLTHKRFRDYPWPYGSFLGAAAIYAYFGGQGLILAYLHWSGLA